MEEKRNNRQSDSSANQSDNTEDISSNNDDKTTDDNSGGDISSNNDDETTSDNTFKSNWSIYKLANNRLAGVEKNKDDIEKLGKCIKKKLIDNGMQYKGDNGDKCEPYHLMHFFYCTKEKNNVTAEEIGEQLAYLGGIGDCPGDRRSGNILVFYRLKENVPEAFFLCNGFGFHCILYLSDPLFRTRVAKRFMDGEKIKEIETFSIAGSDIDSKIIYQYYCNIEAVSFLERAIVKLTGRIIEDSTLDNLMQRDGSEAILMTVGINFVKIDKPFKWKEWTKVLELFSNEEIEVEGPNLMKYPWRHHKLEITISDFQKILGVSSNEAERILQKLTQVCKLVDENNHCCLTEHSYLLPQSSELYKELAKKVEGNKVGKMLYQVVNDRGKPIENIDVLSVLQKERQIVVKEDDKYFVCNPILTEDMMEQIENIVPSLKESRLSNFLRCMIPLSEGDYNALYLNYEEENNFTIFPGDTVLANNVELFDILVYDEENHTTYLFHNKEGLDRNTRVSCAQIRNASELLRHDFLRQQQNHIELFWESAVNSKAAKTPYRYFLERKLTKLKKVKLMKMFDENAKIVFVLGFAISQSKASSKLQWKFKPLTLSDFQEEGLNGDDKKRLEENNILTKSGYLTDCFIGMTPQIFATKMESSDMDIPSRTKIYTLLLTKGTCQLSTIAKLELLTLKNYFSRYQWNFRLRLLQLDTK